MSNTTTPLSDAAEYAPGCVHASHCRAIERRMNECVEALEKSLCYITEPCPAMRYLIKDAISNARDMSFEYINMEDPAVEHYEEQQRQMSDTPETDAVIADMNSNIYEHAMKLERERDAYRNMLHDVCDKAFKMDDTKSCEPYDEYILRQVEKLRGHLAEMTQQREHNAYQALLWRGIATELEKHARHSLNCPARIAFDHSHHLACTCGQAAALKRFEEASKQ